MPLNWHFVLAESSLIGAEMALLPRNAPLYPPLWLLQNSLSQQLSVNTYKTKGIKLAGGR